MIEEIQRNRKEIVDKLYLGDLDERFINFVESVYIKGDNKVHIHGKITEECHQQITIRISNINHNNFIYQLFKSRDKIKKISLRCFF